MGCSNCSSGSNCGGNCGGGCSDGCNSCNGPVTVITKQGLQGDPGSNILYSNTTSEDTAAVGPFTDSEFTTLTYTLPETTLKANGDKLKIKSLFHKLDVAGGYYFEMFFGTDKITYDHGAVVETGGATVLAEVEVTRISNTEALVVGRTTTLDPTGTAITINAKDTTSSGEAVRKTILTGLDLTANTYTIAGKASADGSIAAAMQMQYMTVEKVSA